MHVLPCLIYLHCELAEINHNNNRRPRHLCFVFPTHVGDLNTDLVNCRTCGIMFFVVVIYCALTYQKKLKEIFSDSFNVRKKFADIKDS